MFYLILLQIKHNNVSDNTSLPTTTTTITSIVSLTPTDNTSEDIFPTVLISPAVKIFENNKISIESQRLSKYNPSGSPYDDFENKQITNELNYSYSDNVYYVQRANYGPLGEYDLSQGMATYTISGTIYKIAGLNDDHNETTTDVKLMANDGIIWSKQLIFHAYNPIISWFSVGNNVVLAYDNNNDVWPAYDNDVLINGQSMNSKFGFSSTFGAYPIENSIVYFGKKQTAYYLVIDDNRYQLPGDIKDIIDPHCCEPSLYRIAVKNDEMFFDSINTDSYWYTNKVKFK